MRNGRDIAAGLLSCVLLSASTTLTLAAPGLSCRGAICDQVIPWVLGLAWVAGAPALVVLFGLGAHDTRRPGERGEARPTARYVILAALFGLALWAAVDAATVDAGWPWWAGLAAPAVAAPLTYLLGRSRLIG